MAARRSSHIACHRSTITLCCSIHSATLASISSGACAICNIEFTCAVFFRRTQLDELKEERSAIVFRLVPDGGPKPISEADTEEEPDLQNSLEAARQAAVAACTPGTTEPGQSAPRKIYQRSRKVAHYVLMRAEGICECCLKPAPFLKKDGKPYLEPHHVNRLSDGGLDHPRYVGAICPNCHREIHSGIDGVSLNHQLKERLQAIELA